MSQHGTPHPVTLSQTGAEEIGRAREGETKQREGGLQSEWCAALRKVDFSSRLKSSPPSLKKLAPALGAIHR